MRFSTPILFVIVTASLAVPSISWAAPPDGNGSEKANTDSDRSARAGRSRRTPAKAPKVQELDELVVVGRIQKPEVFYVLGRTNFSYRGLTLKKSFVDRIKRSVRRNPF